MAMRLISDVEMTVEELCSCQEDGRLKLRFPSYNKPRIEHVKSSSAHTKVRFLVATSGFDLTLDKAGKFVSHRGLVFTNVYQTIGAAKKGIGPKILAALRRQPDEKLSFFCMGTTWSEEDVAGGVKYWSLVMSNVLPEATVSGGPLVVSDVLPKVLVNVNPLRQEIIRNIHPRWVIPVLST